MSSRESALWCVTLPWRRRVQWLAPMLAPNNEFYEENYDIQKRTLNLYLFGQLRLSSLSVPIRVVVKVEDTEPLSLCPPPFNGSNRQHPKDGLKALKVPVRDLLNRFETFLTHSNLNVQTSIFVPLPLRDIAAVTFYSLIIDLKANM